MVTWQGIKTGVAEMGAKNGTTRNMSMATRMGMNVAGSASMRMVIALIWAGGVTGYPLKRLYSSLSRFQAAEVVVVLDVCFSGAGGRSVIAKGARRIIAGVLTITLGSRGNVTISQNEAFTTPALKVNALDTTGAGDVFHAGYAYGVLQGWPLKKSLAFASAASGLKCRALGGRAGIPSIEEALGRVADVERGIVSR